MGKFKPVPKYAYLVANIKNHIVSDDKSIQFILNDAEDLKYLNAFIADVRINFKRSLNPYNPDHEIEIMGNYTGDRSEVRIAVELPEYGDDDWLLCEVGRIFKSNAIAGDLMFIGLYESFAIDDAFFVPEWKGQIRGTLLKSH